MRVNPKAALGLTAMALPVGYLVYRHVSWESSPQSKKRMLTHQLTFWGMLGLGLGLMHRAFFKSGLSGFGRAWRVGLAGLIAAPAFRVGELLGNRLFPHRTQAIPQQQAGQRYVPAYIPVPQQFNVPA